MISGQIDLIIQIYSLELIRSQARGMDMKENPLIKFVGAFEDDTFTITDTSRTYHEENKNTEIPKLDL